MIARFGEPRCARRRHAARRDDEMVVAVALAARRVYALRREVEMRRAIDDERDLGAQQRTLVARELVAKERAERDAHEGRLVAVFGRIGQQHDSHVAADDFAEQFRRELVGEHHAAEPPPTIRICADIASLPPPRRTDRGARRQGGRLSRMGNACVVYRFVFFLSRA
ncbi:hypothetical protein [Burkholderia pseudomallei]|uniref:hypothetical protein n=1 Tax=Burkholderia pseudomallei TaxID=28450 RepID=UPI0015C42D29|nr:hypothetical protein [Burkholderia pseudomallei]